MPTVHLISGLPCSGKTTYSIALRADTGGVHVSLDYWLITSFGAYSIESRGHDEHVRRVLASRTLIWDVASEFLRRQVDVILDDGFFLRENRMQLITSAQRLGVGAKIHFLDTPTDVLRRLLEARNAKLPQYNFKIDPQLLDTFVDLFEAPTREEGAELVVVDGSDG